MHFLSLITHVIAVFIVFVGVCSEPASVRAQATSGEGVAGWCTVQAGLWTPSVCLSSPDEACRKQWQSFNGDAPLSRYLGAFPTGNPNIYGCSWTNYSYICHEETGGGLNSCGFGGASIVQFACLDGYQPSGYNTCVPINENTPPRWGCNNANPNPSVGDPILLFDGAKIESVTDYVTADGKFLISRNYRSLPQTRNLQAFNDTIRGAVGGWRFGFEAELHFQGTDAAAVTLHLPEGTAYDFTRTGNVFNRSALVQTEPHYRLEFVGAPPASWSGVTGAATQWKVTDEQDRTWILQTFNRLNNNGVAQYDIARPVSVALPGGYVWTFSYDTNGVLQSIADSYGHSFGFTWNFFRYTTYVGLTNTTPFPVTIKEISLPGGGKLRYTYDPALDSSGYSSLAVRRIAKVELLDASSTVLDWTTYQYENAVYPDFLTGETDARGVRYSTTAYDNRGRVISAERYGATDKYTVAYNTPGTSFPNELVRTVTNPLGKSAEYHWTHTQDGNGSHLLSVAGQASTNCPSSASAYTYDANGFVSTETDEEGRVTVYVRDAAGRPTSVTRGSSTPQAATTTIAWNTTYNIPNQIVEPGVTTAITVASATGLVTQVQKIDTATQTVPYSTNGQTRTWSYSHDSTGRLTSVDGPLAGAGDTVYYTYNSAGAIQTITDVVGHVTTVTAWNQRGQPTSITDPNGVVTSLTYEPARGLLIQIAVDTVNSPSSTTIEYDAVGQITKVTQPNGAYETYAYDGARRLTGVTNSAGDAISYTRDAMGNATSTVITRSNATTAFQRSQAFDELGRLIRSIGAASQTHSFGYDRTSNLVSVTDPRSNVFSYGFDPLNRLIQEVDEQGAAVNLTRNGVNEVTAYQDARSLTTTYVRNGFGEVIQESSPDKGTTVYVRDARGLVTQKTDPRGIVTNYTYDNAGRLTHKTYPGYSENWLNWQEFTWDQTQPGNLGQGRLVGISDESGTNWRTFDGKGRIQVDYRTNYPAPAVAVQYSYDAAGNIVGMGYPSGRWVAFSRDAAARISGIVTYQNGSSPADVIASSVTWNPYGPLASLTFGSGLIATYTVDTDYRVTRVQVGPSGTLGGTLDRSLSWTGETVDSIVDNQFPGTTPPFSYGAQTQTFTYTPTRRLSTAVGYYGSLGWSYDANGNRTSESANGVTSNYDYPASSNRLASVTPSGGSARSFTYDAAGNILTDTRSGALGMTFQYDVEGRLSKAYQTNASGNNATYAYDAANHLVSRTVTKTTAPLTKTTLYVHDINDHIIAETDASGATQREYIWLNDIPVAVVDNVASGSPVIYFVHTDHLGRPARMTAANWNWVWDVIYSPFGEASYIWTNPATMDIRFPGQWFQLETGLHYNWNRHYDASIGRYVQPDPLRVDEKGGATVAGVAFSALQPRATLIDEIYSKSGATRFGAGPGVKAIGSASRASYPDGPSIFGYGSQNPLAKIDPEGLQPNDKRFGLPKLFWRWYHRECKQAGDADLNYEEACALHDEWCRLGKP